MFVFQSCTYVPPNREEESTLLSAVSNKASCVFLTTDEKNNPVISWVETDSADNHYFYFANWIAEEKKFGSSKLIPIASNTSIHEEGMPKIAFKGNGTMIALYETNVPVENSRFGLSDLIYTLSHDKGGTWTDPKPVQSKESLVGSRSFANILRLGDGEVGVSWLDSDPVHSDKGRPVKFAKTEGGGGFSEAAVLEPYACQCCRTAISDDGEGNISVVYRDILPGSVRDISVSKSSNYGDAFEDPIPFSNDQWVVEGCPHNGPSVVSKEGTSYVAWYTGSQQNGVFYAELDQNNHMSAKRCLDVDGRFVQLCLVSDGTRVAAFNKNYQQDGSMFSKIVLNKINDLGIFQKEVTQEKSHASYPVIQELDNESVLVAWSDDGKVYYTSVNTAVISDRAEEPRSLALNVGSEIHVELSSETDPVCGMHIGSKTKIQNTVEHNGKRLGFCGELCKKQFLEKNKTSI